MDVGGVGKDSEAGLGGFLFEDGDAVGEERGVAAEAVYGEGSDEGGLVGGQQRDGAVDGGEDAASVDVADQEDGGIELLREAEIDEVGAAEVELGYAACTFHDDEVVFRGQAGEGFVDFGG